MVDFGKSSSSMEENNTVNIKNKFKILNISHIYSQGSASMVENEKISKPYLETCKQKLTCLQKALTGNNDSKVVLLIK